MDQFVVVVQNGAKLYGAERLFKPGQRLEVELVGATVVSCNTAKDPENVGREFGAIVRAQACTVVLASPYE